MIKEKHKSNLEERGIAIFEYETRLLLLKKIGVEGNSIPFKEFSPITIFDRELVPIREYRTDCPTIHLWFENNNFRVECWNWVPGPGPGDFNLEFEDEESAIKFIESYFFGENEYFELRKRYCIQSRNTINKKEIVAILKKTIEKIDNEFDDSEIEFGERGVFFKTPLESWRMKSLQEEEPKIKVKTGFLHSEVTQLRRKLDKQQNYTHEDVNFVSDLLFELSILLKELNEK